MKKINFRVKKSINIYNQLKSKAISLFNAGDYENSLNYIWITATYAWQVHLGIWYDADLENILFELGKRITHKKRQTSKRFSSEKKHKIVHIANFVYDAGGHSGLIKQWIDILNKKYKNQALYITSPNQTLNYPNLKNFLESKNVEIIEFPQNITHLEKIRQLIKLLEKHNPENLFLYIHPYDVIIIPALTALYKKPKTFFFNHLDFTFWLGRNIIDELIEFRAEGAKYSKKFREININQHIIPLTTNITPKTVSKEVFGVPENSTLSISIGSFWKVIPDSKYNYFKTIEKILEKFPNHYHMLVTDPPKTIPKELLPTNPDIKKRFIITGPFIDLKPVYGTADFLISTFPCGGGMVRAEAMACGIPIIASLNKEFSLLSINDYLPHNYPFIALREIEIINHCSQLIKNPKLREETGKQLYDYFTQKLSPEIVSDLLYNIIEGKTSKNIPFSYQPYNEPEIKYNIDYAYSTIYKYYPKIRSIFFSLLNLKQSLFSIKMRIRFYIESLRRKEIKSKKDILKFAFFAILGMEIINKLAFYKKKLSQKI